MTNVITIGEHKSGLTLEILCPCGSTHEIELDHSGHWRGTCSGLPDGRVMEVQLDPEEWRAIVETQQAEIRH